MKVLVIEDEPRIAGYIKKGLEANGYMVDQALDGEEGFDKAASDLYDLLIIDWMLPSMDGLTITGKLREEKVSTPILMLTAKTGVDDRVKGLEAGADDYLGKPFAFTELLARLKALSRRPKTTRPEKLTHDTLSLDLGTQEVTRAGREISLSRQEFALLEFLMRHPGQVFSSDQLIEQVWSYDTDALPNTAQVYIGYLRKKIDKAFPKQSPLIHTLRGFGYRLGNRKGLV